MASRRRILRYLGVGVGTVVAGCSSDEPAEPDPTETSQSPTATDFPTESDTETEEPSPTETETSSPTPRPEPELELVEQSIYTGPEDRKWIRSVVENVSDVAHGRLNVDYTVRSESDEIVDTQTGLIDLVPPNSRWLNYRVVFGSKRDHASSVEASLRSGDEARANPPLDSIEFSNTRLSKDYHGLTEITGEATNSSGDTRSIYIVGLIYTDSGVLRGSVGKVMNDLGGGETRAFRAAIAKHWTPEDRKEALATRHELFAFGGIP